MSSRGPCPAPWAPRQVQDSLSCGVGPFWPDPRDPGLASGAHKLLLTLPNSVTPGSCQPVTPPAQLWASQAVASTRPLRSMRAQPAPVQPTNQTGGQ